MGRPFFPLGSLRQAPRRRHRSSPGRPSRAWSHLVVLLALAATVLFSAPRAAPAVQAPSVPEPTPLAESHASEQGGEHEGQGGMATESGEPSIVDGVAGHLEHPQAQPARVDAAGPPPASERPAHAPPSAAPPVKVRDVPPPRVSAEYAVLVDEASGAVLYDFNAHGRVAPASLTKIATAIVALEKGQLSDRVVVNVDSRRMPGSTVMGLEPGEVLSLESLLYGLMLPSGNDAALAIADHVGGTRQRFVEMMNAKVAELGLKNTHFVNPHGLDAPGHFSSPYDMVMLARYGMRDPTFQKLAAAKEWRGEGYVLTNRNRFLWSYEGADGVKIGYTDAAGRAIVASAVHNGHRLYVGLMRSADIVYDSTLLMDWGFSSFRWSE